MTKSEILDMLLELMQMTDAITVNDSENSWGFKNAIDRDDLIEEIEGMRKKCKND